MMRTKRNIVTVGFIIIGVLTFLVLNFIILDKLLIPDPCYYHNRETGFLFNLFYDTPSFNGGHPMPTNFNIILTIIIGGLFGHRLKKTYPNTKKLT